jgi:hypothetical protein
MLDLTLAAMLSVGGTTGPAARRREQHVVITSTTDSETPLPENFGATALRQVPTQGLAPSRAITSELPRVDRQLRAAGVLGISAEDQAMVSRVVAENMPKGSTKRLLSRRAKK